MIKITHIILLCSLFMLACGPTLIHQDQLIFTNSTWDYGQPLVTEFNITESKQDYNLVAIVEHTDDYPFENLYVKIHTTFPSGDRLSDQLSIPMADKFGRWIGDCSGNDCTLEIMLQEKVKFKEKGIHIIQFEQFTRTEQLNGISALGFKIERAE